MDLEVSIFYGLYIYSQVAFSKKVHTRKKMYLEIDVFVSTDIPQIRTV